MKFLDTKKGILAMERLTGIPHEHDFKYNGHSYGKNFWKCNICQEIRTGKKKPTTVFRNRARVNLEKFFADSDTLATNSNNKLKEVSD